METYANPTSLVTTEWLEHNGSDPGITLLDVRFSGIEALRNEYDTAHIPGALFVDLRADLVGDSGIGLASVERLEVLMRRLSVSPSSIVVVYDQSFGPWAAYVWWVLRYLGHDDVRLLDGGLRKWIAEGRACETGSRQVGAGTFIARPRPELRAALDDVRAALDAADTVIVDALPGKIYRGEAPMFSSHRLGHIPGAKNISAPSNIDRATNLLLPPDLLSRVWSRLELRPELKVIAYCGAGPYAAFDLFALHLLGHENAAVYEGSWMEWGARSDLPVETGPERGAANCHSVP